MPAAAVLTAGLSEVSLPAVAALAETAGVGFAGGAARYAAAGATRGFLAERALALCRAVEADLGLRVIAIEGFL